MFSVGTYICIPAELPEFLASLKINEKVVDCELEDGKLRLTVEEIQNKLKENNAIS